MTRNQWLILIIALVAFLIWRLVGAFLMFRLSDRAGKKRKTRLGYFVLCFFFGLPAYLYVASLPDWQVLFYLRKIWWVINSDTSENGSHISPRLSVVELSPSGERGESEERSDEGISFKISVAFELT